LETDLFKIGLAVMAKSAGYENPDFTFIDVLFYGPEL
jgi:hypothetical protein